MDVITDLKDIDWFMVFVAVIMLLVVYNFISTKLDWLVNKFGIETKRMREKREDHELLKATTDLTNKTAENLGELQGKIENLTSLFINKEIDDMRWEILNFCSALTSGRKYNKESFDHVIQIHEKYEQILEENNMENGRVTASMEVIMDVYKEKLRTGF